MLKLGGRYTNHHALKGKLFSLDVHKDVKLSYQACRSGIYVWAHGRN